MKKFSLIPAAFLLILVSCKPKEKVQISDLNLVKLWETDTILKTPESVFYHPEMKILFVSNINSGPGEKDGNGYISQLGTDGLMISSEWLTGLNAPKGMGTWQGKLFVTDIDELVIIDIDKAAIEQKIQVEGASFLNDLAVGNDGKIYFSDSGTGKIHIYENGKISEWITEGLSRPNGLFVEDDRVLLVSSESSDLKVIDPETGTFTVAATGLGHGDGIEYTGYPGFYIVSDWAGEVFLIYPDFRVRSLLKTKDLQVNSADIGLNQAEGVVYVPTFFNNRVVAYKMEVVK